MTLAIVMTGRIKPSVSRKTHNTIHTYMMYINNPKYYILENKDALLGNVAVMLTTGQTATN
jgi:hypothetical protein